MSIQDAASTGNRKTTSRRVKFGATLEDLEGRVLLSAVHHLQIHRPAHVRVLPVHHAKPAVHAKPVSHAQVVTPTRMTPAQRALRPKHHKGDSHGDDQRAAPDQHPARDQCSTHRQWRHSKHAERVKYRGEHKPELDIWHAGRNAIGV